MISSIRKEAFLEERGARPGVKRVMVIVTDGESHDGYNLNKSISGCQDDGIERFGIAVGTNYLCLLSEIILTCIQISRSYSPLLIHICPSHKSLRYLYMSMTESANREFWELTVHRLLYLQVLGGYNRENKSVAEVEKFIKEIQSISSAPLEDHFFNVSDEVALLTIVDALGSRIFALEGIHLHPQYCS